jgi:hypothetical protein
MLTGWLIGSCSAAGSLIAAQYQKKAYLALPRLVLQAGLLIIGFLVLFVEIAYFSGASQRINGWIIWIYEVRESKKLEKEKIEVTYYPFHGCRLHGELYKEADRPIWQVKQR